MAQPKVDPEFRNLIDPLSDDELAQLEQNILAEGIRDPLVVWAGEGILIDGHHRLAIAKKHDLSYDVAAVSLPDRTAVKRWIILNQLGQRNMTREQVSYYRGRLYNELKDSHGGDRKSKGKDFTLKNTAKEVAQQTGVTDRTVKNDAKYAEAVDLLEREGVPRKDLTGKDKRFTKKDAVDICKMPEHDRKETLRLVQTGGAENIKKAKKALRQKKAIERESAALASSGESDGADWTITQDQGVISCDALITDPPYGILSEDWEPEDLASFTKDWASRWCTCGADFIAIFWSQDWLFDGKLWFDQSLSGYDHRQTLIWHYPNNNKPQSRQKFKQTYEPILFYRRKDTQKTVTPKGGTWGDGINNFDCHVAAVPQSNFNGVNRKQHPAQKPLSVMEWLVVALTDPGDLVVDPFCGSGTTGVASKKHARSFHGIELDVEYAEAARRRIASYG